MNVIRLHHCSHLDSYAVRSSSRHVAWIVEHVPGYAANDPAAYGLPIRPDVWRCGCEWGSSGRVCSHILAVQAYEDHEDEQADRHQDETRFEEATPAGIADAVRFAARHREEEA